MKRIYQQQFFDEFPNSFNELNELYGYDNNTQKEGPLYLEADDHIIMLFNSLNDIDDSAYYRKIIRIAIGGKWDADAINYFQHGLRHKVENKPGLVVYILQLMTEKENKSFWYFYFDGAHPKKQLTEQLQGIKFINKKIYDLMIEAQNEVLMHSRNDAFFLLKP